MILDFDLTEAREGATSVYNAPGSINSSLIVSASCRACTRLVSDLSVFIIGLIRQAGRRPRGWSGRQAGVRGADPAGRQASAGASPGGTPSCFLYFLCNIHNIRSYFLCISLNLNFFQKISWQFLKSMI